ncbi:BMC domain-containing protein, partial [Salmonella enterica subsp. enterica serovar Virginia]|nr:BMC domain-containing protein [Salmonella enterica subsp. enterica serovar Virginia]
SIGILGARTGAGPHIMAADEAVKATNTEVVSIELPRDTKGGASGVLQLDMSGFVAVNITEGAVQLFQRDFDTALDVGNVVTA